MSRLPNVVIVLADDVTPAYHGCYGGPTPTAEIDRLAAGGLLFQQSHSIAPLCNPSRYGIFTGQYVGRAASASVGCSPEEPYSIAQNGDLEEETPCLAKILREAGYFTGHCGKWHSNFKMAGKQEWQETLGPDADLDDPEVDSLLRKQHAVHADVVKRAGGFEWVAAVTWGNLMSNRPRRLQFHNPGWTTDAALAFLDEAASDERPFYLHLANTLPHGPDPNASLGADHQYTFEGKLDNAPASLPPDFTVFERLEAAGLQTKGPIAGINAGIVQVDDQIGALRAKLEEIGELENTIFIYTADHGIHGKGTPYIAGFHMPCVVHWPAGLGGPGRSISDPVSHVDFLPTLCEAIGAPIPEDHTLDGVSQLALWKGEGPSARSFTYQEMGVARAVTKGSLRYVAFRYPESVIAQMRNGEMQEPTSFQAYVDGPFCDYNFKNKPHYFDPEQLYDLSRDPHERMNLAGDPAYAEQLAELRKLLHSVTDTLPGPYRRDNPEFMTSLQYRRLAEKRRLRVQQRAVYPEGFDQEKIFNLNLPDPLAPGTKK